MGVKEYKKYGCSHLRRFIHDFLFFHQLRASYIFIFKDMKLMPGCAKYLLTIFSPLNGLGRRLLTIFGLED